MEQERTIYQLKDVSKVTGETLLKALAYILETTNDKIKHRMANKHFAGETKWNRFMTTDSKKEVKTFLNNEVNLEKLKDYLREYKIGFASQKLKNNRVMLAFEVKNEALVKEAYEKFLTDLTNPKESTKLNQELLKRPENMIFEEKLEHLQKLQDAKIKAAAEKALKVEKFIPGKEVVK